MFNAYFTIRFVLVTMKLKVTEVTRSHLKEVDGEDSGFVRDVEDNTINYFKRIIIVFKNIRNRYVLVNLKVKVFCDF